jgi:hypothetical protein
MNICSHAHTQPYKVNLLRTATPLPIPNTNTYTAAAKLMYIKLTAYCTVHVQTTEYTIHNIETHVHKITNVFFFF